MDIKRTHTTPAHPQCNSQADKTLAKYMKKVVDESTTNWEWFLAPLMFCYSTTYNRTSNTLPFELTYGMKSRLPAFPTPKLERINYCEGFVAEQWLILKKARQIALDHSVESGDNYQRDHDTKATHLEFM
jgi:hypothetical protein